MAAIDPNLLRQLAHIEDAFAQKCAEIAVGADEGRTKLLRSNWHHAKMRAEVFMLMAMEATHDQPHD